MRMNNLTTFYIVRHGESEGNANFAKHGSYESEKRWPKEGSPLTEKGKQQIKERAEQFKAIHFDAAFSSDLTRAKQSAEILALEKKLAVETRSILRERSMPADANREEREKIEQEIREALKSLDEKGKITYKHGDLESVEEAATRMLTFLREAAVAYPGKTILIASHGNIIRSTLIHLGYASFNELASGSLSNAGYVVIESDGVEFFIKKTQGLTKKEGGDREW